MAKVKNIIKALVPPIILSVFRKLKQEKSQVQIQNGFSGDYASWEDAMLHCTGYDSDLILEKCKVAALKVKNGEAVYQRDSMVFDEIQYSWGVLASLQRAALENDGKLCVLDFGGSLGSSYYQNKDFLNSLKELKWCVIEQSNFVDCGKNNFENEHLKFYHTIEESLEHNRPHVLLLSSVLQYLERPNELLDKMLGLGIPYMILDRLSLSNEDRDILTIQHVPKSFYESILGHWFFSYKKIISKFTGRYELIASSVSYVGNSFILNGKINCYFNLLIFKIKK